MKFTAQQIATVLDGNIVGNPDVEISKLSKIDEGTEGSLTFLSNPRYTPYIYSTGASAAIVSRTFMPIKPIKLTLIKVDDVRSAFAKILEYYNTITLHKEGIEQPVFISTSSSYGARAYIGAFSYIGDDVTIGDDVKIFPNTYIGDHSVIGDCSIVFSGVKIHSGSVIGRHCVINAGAVIGSDGFGFAPDKDGHYKKVPQTGNVIIEDHVDVGAATTIDKASLGSTIIREGVKLDNQIQIAHNVEIGKNTVIAAQTGIAGSTKIGENCQIGGQVGIVGHLTIGNGVKIQAQSGVTHNVKDREVLQGSPAITLSNYNRSYIHFKNLSKIVKQVDDLNKVSWD